MTSAFTALCLLPMSDRDKDTEILALRHQNMVLERQLGSEKIRFSPSDRAFLAALLHRLSSQVLRRIRLMVRPDTVLRRHRDLVARRHAARSRPKRRRRPRTVHSIRLLVRRLARETPGWGYRRIHGELLVLGVTVAESTVWEILRDPGIKPSNRPRGRGLAVVRQAVHHHNGTIDVSNETGAVFTNRLPRPGTASGPDAAVRQLR